MELSLGTAVYLFRCRQRRHGMIFLLSYPYEMEEKEVDFLNLFLSLFTCTQSMGKVQWIAEKYF